MNRGRIIVLLLGVAAIAALVIVGSSGGGDDNGGGGSAPSSAPEGAVTIGFAYSPEKQDLLKPLIDEFNASETKVGDAPVFVQGQSIASGDAEQKIASGALKPVAWSPASSLWGRLLNYEADRDLAPEEAPSIVRTPLVIAMWEPMARALGWPDKPLGFEDILALARSPQGWAAYGHPEFGDFKLVHTNPDFSTSGLEATVAEYYAATGKTEGLIESDINGRARLTVRDIERSIVHYGDTTLFVADQMRKEGPAYASAAAMEEATLVDFNQDRAGQPKLVAIYPKDGTFFSDSPFLVLNGDWVSQQQKAGAEAFQKFLAEKVTPELAAQSGFRPPDLNEKPVAPLTEENGVDPSQPKSELSLPSPEVLAKIREAWREDRKPANVMLVVDVSGSMADEDRMPRAKEGLDAFFNQLQPQDRVGLTAFDDKINELVPLGRFSANEDQLRRTVRGLFPDGGTAFRDATAKAFEDVRSSAGANETINAVVLLTDGEDTDSSRSLQSLVDELSSQGDAPNQVRVFTIAYSATAAGAADALKQIAEAGGGQAYEGDTEDIEAVYRSISSFF
jgi:Ca-activated chloride channel homolog